MHKLFIASLLLVACSAGADATVSAVDEQTEEREDDAPPNASDSPNGAPGDGPDDTDNAGPDGLCFDGFPRGVAGEARLVARIEPEPEGVAVCANGDVFVSIPNESRIVRVPLTGGEPEPWTTLSGRQPLGMTCVGDALYAADFRSRDAAVVRITGRNDPGTPLPKVEGDRGYSAVNSIAWVPGVGLFASDASNTLFGRIIQFTETSSGVFRATVAKKNLAFPNGVAFSPKNKTLDVSMTLTSKVVSYPIGDDGALGRGTNSWSGTPVLDAIDGIARDENDAVYVAHYLRGFVGRDDEKIAGARSPKSLAFRGGTLLFTSAAGLHAVDVGACGARL